MTSRILAVLLFAFGVTTFAEHAAAQIFQPAPPPAMMPPGDIDDDDDDDVVPPGSGIQSQPLAPLPGGSAALPPPGYPATLRSYMMRLRQAMGQRSRGRRIGIGFHAACGFRRPSRGVRH